MNERITVNIHVDSDTKITAYRSGDWFWIKIGDRAALFMNDETVLEELAGAIDSMSKLMSY